MTLLSLAMANIFYRHGGHLASELATNAPGLVQSLHSSVLWNLLRTCQPLRCFLSYFKKVGHILLHQQSPNASLLREGQTRCSIYRMRWTDHTFTFYFCKGPSFARLLTSRWFITCSQKHTMMPFCLVLTNLLSLCCTLWKTSQRTSTRIWKQAWIPKGAKNILYTLRRKCAMSFRMSQASWQFCLHKVIKLIFNDLKWWWQ